MTAADARRLHFATSPKVWDVYVYATNTAPGHSVGAVRRGRTGYSAIDQWGAEITVTATKSGAISAVRRAYIKGLA